MEIVNRIILHVDGHFISILYRSKSYINKNEKEMRKKYWGKNYIKTMLQYELQKINFSMHLTVKSI